MKKIISGVYCIENKINGKKYIGGSINIHRRFLEHQSELRCGTHHNNYLQKSYNKHGVDSFDFYILEELDNADFGEKEVFYIQYYKTRDEKYGYNLENGGSTGSRGLIMSEEARKKISDSRKGIKHTQKQKDIISASTSKALLGKKPNKGSNSHVGVTKNGSIKNPWVANICIHNKHYYLGAFKTEQEAIEAYNYAYINILKNIEFHDKYKESEE